MESTASAAFGQLLERLRGKEAQLDFAARVGITRQQYGMIKAGKRRPDSSLRDALVARFPECQSEIEKLYADVETERLARREQRSSAHAGLDKRLQRLIANSIKVGRIEEARAGIARSLEGAQSPATRVWLLDQLADLESTDGNPDAAIAARREAIRYAHASGLHDDELRLCLTLARLLTVSQQYVAAHEAVDECLKDHPDAGALWRRKAIVHWYEHQYPDAYACLASARTNGVPLSRIVHTRGQVLAEWGNYTAAVEDLTQAVDEATSPANAAYARSTRAYALANLGDVDHAMSEFALAETVTPANAWLHYFRALCHGKIGDEERLCNGLKRALECEVPRLNSPKQAHAIAILKEHGIEVAPASGTI